MRVLFLLGVMTLCACSTARVVEKGGTAIEGHITSSDEAYVFVETRDGERRVARSDIESMDHPGTPEMWTGGFMLGLGLVGAGLATHTILTTDDPLSRVGALPYILGAAVMIPAGAIIGGVGLGSRWSSEAKARVPASATLAPVLLPDGQGDARVGLGVMGRF